MLHRGAVEGSRCGKPAPEMPFRQSVHPAAYPAPMPLVHPCSEPGCSTLTIGDLCLEHEQRAQERLTKRVVALSRRFRAPAVALAVAAVAALVGRASR